MSSERGRNPKTHVFDAAGRSARDTDFAAEVEFMPAEAETVIDIGCGGGDLVCFMAPAAGLVVGVDVSLDVLKAARDKKSARALDGLCLVVADANRLPFRDGAADYVVSRYALHHTDLDESLPEVRRVIAPGGRLMLRDVYAPLPRIEHWRSWQVFKTLIKTALHVIGNGPRSGWRFLNYNLSRESMRHMLHENRLVDGETYREAHRRCFGGCEFERMRPRYLFWEAPTMRWRKPPDPGDRAG